MNVHPELAGTLDRLPLRPENPYADVPALRASFRALMAASDDGVDTRVEIEAAAIPGPGANLIDCHVIRPRGLAAPLPAVIYIHGGGFAYGELDGPSQMARDASVIVGAVVVNPHYRLAPEHRFPARLEDCYDVLSWVIDHAADLGIDPNRIAVAGASAGGCLSAALCLLSRDRGGPSIAFQCLLIPVLDDRPLSQSRQAITDARVINGPGIEHTWDTYLGADRDPTRTSIYAAPGRATDLSGLPPAYVLTCGLDPLCDEGLDYALRLARSGVPLELHHVPGAWHFFEAHAPHTELAQSTTQHWMRALRDALR
jgi:acetyl esterase/lipase